MSSVRETLWKTADTVFRRLSSAHATQLYDAIDEVGLDTLLVPEHQGGFGGDWGDALSVLELAGRHLLSAPIGENMVARRMFSSAGVDIPTGWASLADVATGRIEAGAFTGSLSHVPWGGSVKWIVAVVGGAGVVLPVDSAQVQTDWNLAGEARDTLVFECVPINARVRAPHVRAFGAFVRAAQSAGALEAALALSVDHVRSRRQFGKALSTFQSVQHALAVVAMELSAVKSATGAAGAALDIDEFGWEAGAAKLRTNLAIGTVTGILHQVHGAIGFTEEHPLQLFTRRLLAWRSEYGGDRYWAEKLGKVATGAGPEGFWDEITARVDGRQI